MVDQLKRRPLLADCFWFLTLDDVTAAGTLAEAKQLSALQALLSLTSGPEAGFLGSSWVIILRCISALDALKVGHAGT